MLRCSDCFEPFVETEREETDEQLRERADWKWFGDQRVGIPLG